MNGEVSLISYVLPLYLGYGIIYYKLGKIETELKLMNGKHKNYRSYEYSHRGVSMEKNWYKSKTMLAGIVLIAVGIFEAVTGQTIDPEIVVTLASGLGLIGLRQALG